MLEDGQRVDKDTASSKSYDNGSARRVRLSSMCSDLITAAEETAVGKKSPKEKPAPRAKAEAKGRNKKSRRITEGHQKDIQVVIA